jgi:outer membrane protein assembly factor BamB
MELLMRAVAVSFACLVIGVVVGCSSNYKLNRDRLGLTSPWSYYSRGYDAVGSLSEGDFSGKLNVVWEAETSGKPAGPMTIHYGLLVYPDAKKKIRFYDLRTGVHQGKIKCKGVPQTGVTVKDSLAFFSLAPRKNELHAVNLLNGDLVWRRSVEDAASGSIIGSDGIIVSSRTGSLAAFDTKDGSSLWEYSAAGRFVAPASSRAGKIYQPSDQGALHVLSEADGTELYQTVVEGPVVSPVAVSDLIYMTSVLGKVYGIDSENGDIVWSTEAGGPVWTAPAVDESRVYVGHSGGEVVAMEATTGQVLWRFATGEVIKASPLAVGSVVVAGTGGGSLYVLNAEDGSRIDSLTVEGSVDTSPISDGRRVYVATDKGRIICFGGKHGNKGDQRSDIQNRSE